MGQITLEALLFLPSALLMKIGGEIPNARRQIVAVTGENNS
jgi:hypothetical protein